MEEKDLVKTINGKVALKDNCRLINKQYYLIGNNQIENSGDVYLINNRYVRFTTGKVVFNYTKKEYQLKSNLLIEGVVSFKNSEPILGYFEFEPLNTIKLFLDKNKWLYCLNEEIIPYTFREHKSTGDYYHIKLKSVAELNKIRLVSREYKESLTYDSKDIIKNYIKQYEANYNPTVGFYQKLFNKVVNGLSFGLEFETIKGQLTNNKLNILPLIPLRDGSINGLEYVTLPLEGERGLQAVTDCVKELGKRTEYDDTCSLHVHIGNIPRNPEFILAFYKFISYFQDEFFEQFPLYKKYNFEVKRKNYSQPFPINRINYKLDPIINHKDKEQVTKNFNILFKYLSEGVCFDNYKNDLKNVNGHPNDPKGVAKWNIHTRYHFINFIPLIFGNKQTIEFRIHTPTYDINKIMHFLIFNCIIINFVKENFEKILQLPDLLDRYGSLEGFVQECLYNNHLKLKSKLHPDEINILVDFHMEHLSRRKRSIYHFSKNGNIIGNEKEILINNFINWDIKELAVVPPRYKFRQSFEEDNAVLRQKQKLQQQIKAVRASAQAQVNNGSLGITAMYAELNDQLQYGTGYIRTENNSVVRKGKKNVAKSSFEKELEKELVNEAQPLKKGIAESIANYDDEPNFDEINNYYLNLYQNNQKNDNTAPKQD